MPAGEAYGAEREYQVYCRDILQMLDAQKELQPYEADGIDVKIKGKMGTSITFDILLRDLAGKLCVAECRKRVNDVKQNDLFAFAYEVEWLREQTGEEVAGIFFTISNFQNGAIKHAALTGIDVVVCPLGQTPLNFSVSYKKYDPERNRVIQAARAHLTAIVSMNASLSMKIIRADESREIE